MKVFALLALSTVVLLGSFTNCDAQMEPIGIVKSLDNSAFITRKNENLKAEQGMAIVLGDEIRTGPDGKIGIIFKDDTIISMGPQSRFIISEFLFEPVEGKLSFIGSILRGTISFLSGQIVRLAPDSVRLELPAGIVGVRGTHILIRVEGE
ncbi:MAG: FecR domain-containing protein [Syntrophaceae bacterium]|nr:FecR domain-containing protein [Syntrophaceae bacterium]